MSEKMTREDIVRMARAARLAEPSHPFNPVSASDEALARFAHKVVEHFLATTGQYVTNDASREAAIRAAVGAEREACAKVCEGRIGWATKEDTRWSGFRSAMRQCADVIRARGEK
mgnify:CR=1 FL=1